VTRPRGLIGSVDPEPSRLYRFLRRFFDFIVRLLFEIEVRGAENMPSDESGRPMSGWIAIGVPHRTWVEFFIFLALLPARPRLIMLGEGPTMFGSAWRRALMKRVGGVVPVWRGSTGPEFESHASVARQAIVAGAIFGLFPEVGRAARPPALRRVSPSVAYFALRSGAPIVAFVFGGTHELYLRRKIEVRILPPLAPLQPAPPAGTAREREAADALLAQLLERVRPEVDAAHASSQPPPGKRKIARWLTGPYPQAD
jgi:1-acyl-sn-glycerol-3-phosphate acyltransferase